MRDIIGLVYTISFIGRFKDSIGKFIEFEYELKSEVELTNEEIKIKIYETYDHITNLDIKREFIKGERY